jgi:hypothetical protein
MKENLNKYFILVIAIVAFIILVIIIIAYFFYNNRVNTTDLASVNGQFITKNELINYSCNQDPSYNSKCKTNYISDLNNFINYKMEYDYLSQKKELPSFNYVTSLMSSFNTSQQSFTKSKKFLNSQYYKYYYQQSIKSKISNLLLKNYKGYIFTENGANDNTLLSQRKIILSKGLKPCISGLCKSFSSKVFENKYNINDTNYKSSVAGINSIFTNIQNLGISKISNVYFSKSSIGSFHYILYNSSITGEFSGYQNMMNYLKSIFVVTIY